MKVMKILLVLILFSNVGCLGIDGRPSVKIDVAFKKNNKMDEQEFWRIIDYAFEVAGYDSKKKAHIIEDKLAEYTPEQITDFEIILERKIIAANDFKIIAIDQIIDGSVSDDTFLYFRCWLIGLGQNTFEETMKNPDNLADKIEKGPEPDFEDLLYVSTEAYQRKAGKKEEDASFPRDVAYKKGLNYDFGGPKTTGRDWKKSELPKLYPKLWSKFN